jgi:uncharacterized protein YecE (DUF72 family)
MNQPRRPSPSPGGKPGGTGGSRTGGRGSTAGRGGATAGRGEAGKGGAGKGRGGKGGSGGGPRPNRRRTSPLIRVGITVAPLDVPTFASQFRVLEADAGNEALTDRIVGPWVDRTPDGFIVDVRAHRLLTHHGASQESIWPEVRDALSPSVRAQGRVYGHDLPAKALDDALDRFLASIRATHEFGKLGTVVLPFPSYFRPSPTSFDYLAWLRERSGDIPLAAEFRHREWVDSKHRPETMRFLEEQRIGYIGVDVPPGFDSSLPPLAVATADIAVVRFHGRNADAWQRDVDTGDDRFASEYRLTDFTPWVARLEKLAAAKHPVHAIVTTKGNEGAARNARLLVRALTEEPEPTPEPPPRTNKPRRPRF